MVTSLLDHLIERIPQLASSRKEILQAYDILVSCFEAGGKLLICGNGGSAADADHIAGELMKRFSIERPIADPVRNYLVKEFGERGRYLAEKLEGALPAISLNGHQALSSAFANDVDAELIFAQQVVGYRNIICLFITPFAKCWSVTFSVNPGGNATINDFRQKDCIVFE